MPSPDHRSRYTSSRAGRRLTPLERSPFDLCCFPSRSQEPRQIEWEASVAAELRSMHLMQGTVSSQEHAKKEDSSHARLHDEQICGFDIQRLLPDPNRFVALTS